MKVVYVTGCLGFIGSYVTKTCLDLGWYVKGVDKITYAANKDLLVEFKKYPNFSFVNCDINDLKFLYDCDYVINTAAETHVGNSIANSDDFVHSNVNGVHNLLELIKNHRGENISKPTLLHFSTDEVYGAWGRTYGLPYIIVRPTNNYGIGQYVEKLIPKTCKYLKLGRKVPLHNGGTPIRNWLHAQDTADAIITIINAGVKNEIYNICGGFEQNNLETVKKICILDNKNLEELNNYIDFSCVRPGQDVRYALNDSKLQRLGWKPKKEFDNELPLIVQHYRNKFIW